MANRAILLGSNSDLGTQSQQQELAECVYGLPILWLGMYRASDLKDGESLSTTLNSALHHLSDAVAVIAPMFKDHPVVPYVQQLSAALAIRRPAIVSLDYSEIESMDDPVPFRAKLRYAMLSLEGSVPVPVGRSSFIGLSGADPALLTENHFIGGILDSE